MTSLERVSDDEPTQTTDEGLEIPVPKRGDVLDALRKAAKVKSEGNDDDKDDTG